MVCNNNLINMAHCEYFEEAAKSLTDHLPIAIAEKIKVAKIYCTFYQSKKEVRMEVDASRLTAMDFEKVLTTMGATVMDNDNYLRMTVFKNQKLMLAFGASYDK